MSSCRMVRRLAMACLVAAAAAATPAPAAKKASALPANVVLENKSGFKVAFTPIGATIQSLWVPACDKSGKAIDVALGFDDVAGYMMDPHPSFGATVGRVANRISGAKFSLDGKQFKLLANDGPDSIHGGEARWSKTIWAADKAADGLSVTFTLTSKDGDGGFPGTVQAKVVYSIPPQGTWLNISMSATTDKATPINVINHAYFNLKGEGNGDILDHVVQIPAQYYTPAPSGKLLPTGQIAPVKGTVYDFTKPKPVGQDLKAANGGPFKGFDLNYLMPLPAATASAKPTWWAPKENPQVLSSAASAPLTLGATVTAPKSGLTMRVYTNAPGIHFYSGNFMSETESAGKVPNKRGQRYPQYYGFCFETQGFPNAINTPSFPSVVVRPGQTFSNRVAYDFSC